VAAVLSLIGATAGVVEAQYGRTPDSHIDPAVLSIDESRHLGTPIGGDLRLVDEQGRTFVLGELFGKPLLLLLSYYSCDGACPTVNRRLAQAIGEVDRFLPGEDFRVLTLSFDRRDRPDSVRGFVRTVGLEREAARGWRFALFEQGDDIRRIAESVGYRYFWSVRDRMFLHPNVLIVLSPEGRVVRYLPAASIGKRDVELAMIESDWGRVSESTRVLDILSGVCFSYSYKDGRYVLNAPLFIAAGSLTLGFAAIVAAFSLFRRFRRKEAHGA